MCMVRNSLLLDQDSTPIPQSCALRTFKDGIAIFMQREVYMMRN